ncbi:DNA-processing protein DprA [Nocardioides sp.]|uniref:DNA-processing protein DprA n=1 Tax=Nocardioides sp. TaxID=35761 RepID=UPI0026067220|nr:DNA-processing protein DprA [Nocardioides sp.]
MSPASLEEERRDRLVLSLIFEPGDPRVADLVERFGAPRALELIRANLLAAEVVTDAAQRLTALRPDTVLDVGAQIGARYVIPGDEEWPAPLEDLVHAGQLSGRGGVPLGLWVRGQRLDRLVPRVAIVGSRSATTYGVEQAALIAAECTHAGHVVVSGGAFGIDIAAHRATLAAGGSTIVALAHGLDRVYPVAHAPIVEAALATGAMVSELAPGTAPMQLRFLARNRLIAGLAAGTVIVEAGVRSGALNTANWTSRLSRPLMAVPGPTTSSASRGTHELIRSGAAVLTATGPEVVELLTGPGEVTVAPLRAPTRRRDRLDTRSRQLLEAVPLARPADVSRIATVAGIGLLDAQRMIRRLEEQRLVVFEAGGWRLASPDEPAEDLPP